MATENDQTIKTIAAFDFETNGLPWEQFNKCSITELSMYAFSAQCLKDQVGRDNSLLERTEGMDGIANLGYEPPDLPRVLHKLTLMVNPLRMIHPEAERLTGLSNDMLENEAPFDKNTANCLLAFLDRFQKPICLVAHNGWGFDFPVLRHVLEKINMTMPSSIFCVDSLKAFIEIDEKQIQLENVSKSLVECKADILAISPNLVECDDNETIVIDPLEENEAMNWQKANETTPNRKCKAEKRKRLVLEELVSPSDLPNPGKRLAGLNVRRTLFTGEFQPKTKYPPKGKYKLGNIYERFFGMPVENLHSAETDVRTLTILLLHYGLDFLAYAEERKETFDKVKQLGR